MVGMSDLGDLLRTAGTTADLLALDLAQANSDVVDLHDQLAAASVELERVTLEYEAYKLANPAPEPEPDPEPDPVSVYDLLAGVHVLHQAPQNAGGTKAQAMGELDRQASAVRAALAVPGVVGFGVRVPWNLIDTDLDLLDRAREIAGDSQLTIRFMAGRHTPQRILNVSSTLNSGVTFPAPFTAGGEANGQFLYEYEAHVARLAAWCRANDVHLLHLSHYAKDWAEFYAGPEVQGISSSWRDHLVTATNALVDIGLAYAGPDLACELPMSGHGPLMRYGTTPGVSERVTQHIASVRGDRPFFIQGNGWDHDGIWGAPSQGTENQFAPILDLGVPLGVQMIQPTQFDWPAVFAQATAKQATYGEVYLPSFSNTSSLPAEIGAWVPSKP